MQGTFRGAPLPVSGSGFIVGVNDIGDQAGREIEREYGDGQLAREHQPSEAHQKQRRNHRSIQAAVRLARLDGNFRLHERHRTP